MRSLAEDEVLRAFDNLLRSTLRTNAYQRPERPVFSIKVDSQKVEGMPSPRPMVEVYVHSRRIEGIHLRGGRVARGGIRWSDRHDDFRTEVLGLMKTQMVKNSVIVPVGSKGGFVLKGDVPPRPALDEYLIDRYREYVSGLLDVTDNRANGTVLHPPEVVRQDGDDPYLVVAADKGTAHLSDTANGVSTQYGFWLGDAFASGGSAGYDHKKMGITARGAWECVKHHFRNLGTDIQSEPFTCVGIGDMSGDVFGNGMLLSPVTRLVAAFDHRHIFIDPAPDAARSFAERQRVFDLARSSWRDYDARAISKGGGVFDRSAKSIPLSPEARKALDVEAEALSGEELIKKILTAPVDLLYNGGIGTYVKAASETHAQVGDRSNDRVRVDGREVRARVVGEGGNLGLTQKGRLEYWAAGGLVNTDAVDNSGGVDTSDHEVNIKILLDMLVKKGLVKGRAERNAILAEMTDEVAALVLADNDGQALALSLDTLRSQKSYEELVALVDDMAGAGLLNRQDESVPSRDELLASPQRQRGLPRPLLCVLLGYSKMSAFQLLLETDFPDGAAGRPFLDFYFPRLLRERFADRLADHVLRREIIATGAVNYMINRGGISLLPRLEQGAKNGIGEAVTAWIEADREADAEACARRWPRPRCRRPRSRRRSWRSRPASRPRRRSGSRAGRPARRRRSRRSARASRCDCRSAPPAPRVRPARGPPCGGGAVIPAFFVSDLHGRLDRYEKLLAAVEAERPAAVLLGGDLLPFGALTGFAGDFLLEWLGPRLIALRSRLGSSYPRVLAIFGNDDPRAELGSLLALEAQGLVEHAHGRRLPVASVPVYGYACVPPTPFRLKDWERYDVSRYVDPGCVSPEEGHRSVAAPEEDVRLRDDRRRPRAARGRRAVSRARSSSSTRRPTARSSTARRSTGAASTTSRSTSHVGSIAVRRFIEARQPLAHAARPRPRVGAAHRSVA